MNIYVATQDKNILSLFSETAEQVSETTARKKILDAGTEDLFYFHLENTTERKVQNLVNLLSSIKDLKWAIIDSDSIVKDPAVLFFRGACDYIRPHELFPLQNKSVSKNSSDSQKTSRSKSTVKSHEFSCVVDDERLKLIATFFGQETSVPQKTPAKKSVGKKAIQEKISLPFPGWAKLVAGREYEFVALLASINDHNEMRNKIGVAHFSFLQEVIQLRMRNLAKDGKGIVWIDDGQGFLLLFPPTESKRVVFFVLDLLANMRVFSFESCKLGRDVLSMSFGLHKTILPWQKPGKTQNIVSDELNFIYHLSKHCTTSGCLDVTDIVFNELPEKTQVTFADNGMFEEKHIYRFFGFSFYNPLLGTSKKRTPNTKRRS